jgi:outer membrane protein OmpA-like peptidoglycan-associated protein
MKSTAYVVASIILGGVLILGGCITTPFSRGDKVSETTTQVEIVEAGFSPEASMDSQENRLRKSLDQTGVDVTRQGKSIHLNIPGHLTFAPGSFKIKSGAHRALNKVADVLNEFPETRIHIYGHTDSVGKESFNRTLSTRRAESVARYLAAQGISLERFSIEGFGETRPIASNNTKVGRAKNRRVEIEILPIR